MAKAYCQDIHSVIWDMSYVNVLMFTSVLPSYDFDDKKNGGKPQAQDDGIHLKAENPEDRKKIIEILNRS